MINVNIKKKTASADRSCEHKKVLLSEVKLFFNNIVEHY